MNSLFSNKNRIWIVLAIALICVVLGRSYQCVFWDIPIRSLMWNEDLLSRVIFNVFDLSWDEYLIESNISGLFSKLVSFIGWSLFLCLPLLFLKGFVRKFGAAWITLILVFIAFLYHLEKFKTAGQFFEYSLQFMMPTLFLLYAIEGASKRWKILAKVCIALTFTSHGLYALGFYPVPGNFVAMTINILPVDDGTAIGLLKIAGIIDLVVSVGIFWRGAIFTWSIWYCIIWGTLTAMARIVANIDMQWLLPSLHQWAYETIYRAPHFLVPLAVWLAYQQEEKSIETISLT